MSDFETVYTESFLSATGADLRAQQHQARHDTFVGKAIADTLSAWTETSTRSGIRVVSRSRDTINQHITHPNQSEFSETDVETIARVRFLGRSAIDVAKHGLVQSQRFTRLRNRDPGDIFDYFQSYFWHEVHPTVGDTNDEHDPDAASPLRLADWPYGQNVNCLGMSIAMSAASEYFGLTYVYANEIRNSQGIIAQEHTNLMQHVRRVLPNFDSPTTRSILKRIMHEVREPDEKYDDILFDTPHILQVHSRVRDFHHFVVCESPAEVKDDGWVQVDPFDLSFEFLYPENRQIDKALDPIFTKGNENSVVLSDEYTMTTGFYRLLSQQLRLAYQMGNETMRSCEDGNAHKSPYFVEHLYDEIVRHAIQISDNVYLRSNNPEEETEAHITEKRLIHNLYLYHLVPFAHKIPAAKEFVERTMKKDNHATFGTVAKGIEAIINREVGYNPSIRKEFVELMTSLPLLYLVHTYEYNLKATLRIRDLGNATPVMELADPEFMIGAMYMNHYATWRKAGRINIARHLSRICSSQLLWQAARQGENEFNERIVAMGQVVHSLKPRQLHPLVNIARGIPTPQPR